MKRRVMIAKALIHQPKILVLDEPTAGVDIDMRHSMYELLRALNKSGTTIILTTHYLEEAEKLCDRIAIINDGRLIADEPKERLIEQFGTSSVVEVQFDREPDKSYLETLKEYHPRVEQASKLYLTVDRENITKMLQTLVQLKIGFGNLAIERPKLEDVYLNLIHQ
jgi:ABC-2 type transport system ATP-binding protein